MKLVLNADHPAQDSTTEKGCAGKQAQDPICGPEQGPRYDIFYGDMKMPNGHWKSEYAYNDDRSLFEAVFGKTRMAEVIDGPSPEEHAERLGC